MAGDFVKNLTTSGVQGLFTEAAKGVVSYAAENIDLSSNLERFFEKLKAEVEKIEAIMKDHEKTAQKHKDKMTTSFFDVWRGQVRKMIEETKKLEESYEGVNESSKFWLLSRGTLAEHIRNVAEEVEELKKEGKSLGKFLVDKPLERVVKVNAPNITGFHTLYRPLQKVLGFLNDRKVKRVAVCGSLGVGKTTIMQNLNNHEDVSKTFEVVIFIQVSGVTSEEELQKKIAARLKNEDVSESLKDKTFLLLLDNVECSFELERIGITNNNRGSKVVISTKSKVVASQMDVDRLITVQTLTKDEAWNMFEAIIGDVIDSSDIEPIARQVAQECGGIPLLIKKVASYFKLKSTDSEWRLELEKIRRCPEERVPGFNDIHAFVNLCYENLESEEQKHCFLYGALFPANTSIFTDILVEHWANEQFLGSINEEQGFHAARDQGNAILRHLLNMSLFESDEKVRYVNLSDIVRHVALRISSNILSCRFLHEASKEPSHDVQNVNNWKESKRISIIGSALPESPNCTTLLSLMLPENAELKVIPPSLFDTMENLLVLNLQNTGIGSLPSSVEKVTGLKGLYLNGCSNLTELPPEIRKLQHLLVLDTRDSKVPFMSVELENLEHLRCLRLSYPLCNNPNASEAMEIDDEDVVVSKLLRLEELTIEVSASDDRWTRDLEKTMKQMATLENLKTLKLGFLTPTIVGSTEYNQIWERLNSFWLFVGCRSEEHPKFLEHFDQQIKRYLRYDGGACNSASNSVCPRINIGNIQALELINNIPVRSLTDLMPVSGLSDLVGCMIERCSDIKTIIDGAKLSSAGEKVLQRLQQLHLRDLAALQSIVQGSVSRERLRKLHTIVVTGCPMLTSICSLDKTQCLSNLQKLVMRNCSEIKELVVTQSIKVLELHNLPKLNSVSQEHGSSCFPNLTTVKVSACHELKSLPFGASNVPELKSIEGEQGWWERLQLQEEEAKVHLQYVFRSIR